MEMDNASYIPNCKLFSAKKHQYFLILVIMIHEMMFFKHLLLLRLSRFQ